MFDDLIYLCQFSFFNVNMFEDKTKMPGTQWKFYALGLGPGRSSPEDPVTWKGGIWPGVPSKTASPHALPCTCWLGSPSWSGLETVEGANVIIHLLNTYLLSTYYWWALRTQAPAPRRSLEKKKNYVKIEIYDIKGNLSIMCLYMLHLRESRPGERGSQCK